MTMNNTNAPMNRIITGPRMPTAVVMRSFISRSWFVAARSSMVSSSPLVSPLAMRWMSMGGNSLRCASERAMGAPSRTRTAASATASRMGTLATTSPAIRMASSTGTALEVSVDKVRAKRAAFTPRATRPMSGRVSTQVSNLRRAAGFCSQRRKPHTLPPMEAKMAHHQARNKSLKPMRNLVAKGSSCLPVRNTFTTSGTTFSMSTVTMMDETMTSSVGYTMALRICDSVTCRLSVYSAKRSNTGSRRPDCSPAATVAR